MLKALTATIVALTLALVVTTEAAEENAAGGPLQINYDMPRDADLSMGVFDKDGQLLRHIAKSDFRSAGKNVEYWDGRDQYGKPIPAGEYLLKALYHDRISTEYALTLGNPGNPAWPTPDGKGDWLSDEANPQAVVTDGKWVYLAAPGSELGWSVIAIDENGQRQWGVNVPFFPRCVSLSLQGDNLYALYSGPETIKKEKRIEDRVVLLCLDKRTGSAAGFTKSNPRLKIASFPYQAKTIGLWELRNNKSYEPGVYGGQPRYFDINFGDATSAMGVAATSKTVYASMYFENKLRAIDAQTGESKPADDIAIQKPVGLYPLSDDALLAVSDGKVVRIDLRSKAITPVITSNLAAPHSLTVDKKNEIYVSDWKDSFQVKVFSQDGKLLRAIGKPGGRPWTGLWESDGMLVPRGIAVTDEGKLWVAEDDESPKRVSVWNAASGAFEKDYIGPTPYGGGATFWIDRADPTIAHTMGTRFKLDWEKKTYAPEATELRRMSQDQPFAVNGHSIFGANGVRYLQHGGKEYVGIAYGGKLYVIITRKGDTYIPVAAFGGLQRTTTDDGTGFNQWDSDIGKHMIKSFWPEFFRGHVGDNFSWYDRNADGLVQSEEMTWVKSLSRSDKYVEGRQPEFFSAWGVSMDADWNLYFTGFCSNQSVISRLGPTGWTDAGVPIYDINQAQAVVKQPVGFDGIYAASDGRIYGTGIDLGYYQIHPPYRTPRPEALTCFDRTGKKLWSLATPDEQGPKDVMASNTIGEFKLSGIGNVICTWQWWGNYRPYIVSSDGLYVGTALDEGMTGPAGIWGESYNYFYQAPDGTPYIINGGNQSHHILRLRGLEKGGRFESKLVISDADAQLAAATAPLNKTRIKAEKPVLSVRWLATAPVIDGNLSEWDLKQGVSLDGGEGRTASVALGRDADNLYLSYHVNDDSPMLNKGSSWQTLFMTGDCVDLMLALNPKADPIRAGAVAGDKRLLLGVFQDSPVAVLYEPVISGSDAAPVRLMAAQIDRIDRLADAKVAIRRGDGFYEIEAVVPLKTLGISPAERTMLRGDAGVIYSDATGTSRVKRLYHYNQRTQIISDLTTEATLQPAEWGAMWFPLGNNLLKNGGFEDELASQPQTGWVVQNSQNGLSVDRAADLVRGGQQTLRLGRLSAGPIANPTKDGKGYVSVSQQTPVTGGKKYSLRYFYQANGLKPASAALRTHIRWIGKDLKAADIGNGRAIEPAVGWGDAGHLAVADVPKDPTGWTECYDQRLPNWYAPRAYLAPDGATAAEIVFAVTSTTADKIFSVWIDDVEFVEESHD